MIIATQTNWNNFMILFSDFMSLHYIWNKFICNSDCRPKCAWYYECTFIVARKYIGVFVTWGDAAGNAQFNIKATRKTYLATHNQSTLADVNELVPNSPDSRSTFHTFMHNEINYFFIRLPIYCALSGPCLYVWLNFGSPVDAELYDQYKFGCISMIVSGIIELLAEVPVFVAQVFCFVKLRVVLDTLNIFVRSVIFVVLVIRDPKQAIYAFSIAQVGSTITFVIGYYTYFIYYTGSANRFAGTSKRAADSSNDDDSTNKNEKTTEHHSEPEDVIPFSSIKQMFPGCQRSSVYKNAMIYKDPFQ